MLPALSDLGPHELGLVPVVTLAFLVQTVTGFGGTVLAVTFGSWLVPIDELVPVLLLVDLPLVAFLALRDRARVDRAALTRLVAPWMGSGVAVGALVAPWLAGDGLRRLYGVLVVALVGREWLVGTGGVPSPVVSRASTLAAGVVHGLYGSGGPLLVVALRPAVPDRSAFRATLCAVWLVFDAVVLATLAARGEVTAQTLWRALCVAPALPIGSWLGDRLHDRVSERSFTNGVRVLLAFGGLALALG